MKILVVLGLMLLRMASLVEEPEAHVVEPTAAHRHTIVLLHGTSQTGATFADPFLAFKFPFPKKHTPSSLVTLPEVFPDCKWVFPTGERRKTTVLGDIETHAWFNFRSFADRTLGENDSISGIRSSALLLASLITHETALLPPDGRLILGGFSQGCAMGIMLLLTGLGVEVAGFVGMSGWLPFRRQLGELPDGGGKMGAVQWVRELLGFEGEGKMEVGNGVRVWLATGEEDVKVHPEWGREMRDVLVGLGVNARFREYAVEHWWCQEEMVDLAMVFGEMLGS